MQDVPGRIGDEPVFEREAEPGRPGISIGALGSFQFNQKLVTSAFEKLYHAMALYFDSEHWELSPLESELVGQPAKMLLDSCWVHIQKLLPLWLASWAESTPGLVEFVFAMAIVNSGRITEQWSISRERRGAVPREKKGPQPVPAPARPRGHQPIGPIDTTVEPIPFDEGGNL